MVLTFLPVYIYNGYMMNETPKHEFEKAGLGKYPYTFIGVKEKKYQAVPGDPNCPIKPGSSCDFCGTAIMYEFWLCSTDNKRFKVGCDCILRTNSDPTLKSQAKAEQKRIAKENRVRKEVAQREVRKQKWQEEKQEKIQSFLQSHSSLIEDIKKYTDKNWFLNNLYINFSKYGSLSEKQCSAAKEAIDKIKTEETKKPSEHIGTLGQRLTLVLTIKNVIPYEGFDYYTKRPCTQYITILEDANNNNFVYKNWIEQKGVTIEITATIKDHTEYKNVKQTIIQRPKVIRIIQEGK